MLADCSSCESAIILATHNRKCSPDIIEKRGEALLPDHLLTTDITQIHKAVGECFVSAAAKLLHSAGIRK
jgi:hypothetical protein